MAKSLSEALEGISREEEKLIGNAVRMKVFANMWSYKTRELYKKGDELEAKEKAKDLEIYYDIQKEKDYFCLIKDDLRNYIVGNYRAVGMEARARMFEKKNGM